MIFSTRLIYSSIRGPGLKSFNRVISSERPDTVYVKTENGLPHFYIPLPSRKETCVFTVKPLQHTIGDLIRFVRDEDKGVDRIILTSKDGMRLAMSNSVDLLFRNDFDIIINDRVYEVDVSSLNLPKSAGEKEISNVRAQVTQLFTLLNGPQCMLEKERELQRRLEETADLLRPFEEQRSVLAETAAKWTRLKTWGMLGMMGVQFGFLARLTWWEYSWDIMEPVTYFVGYGTSILIFAYYVITKEDYSYPEVFNRQYLKGFYRLSNKNNFDVDKYNELSDQLAEYKRDLKRLRDPLLFQLPLQQTDQLIAEELEEILQKRTDNALPPS